MTSLWLSALQNDTAFWFSSLVYGLYARIRFLIHKILNANKMLLTVKNFIISRITLNKITIFWPIQMKYSTCVSLFIELNENDVKKSCLLWASFFFLKKLTVIFKDALMSKKRYSLVIISRDFNFADMIFINFSGIQFCRSTILLNFAGT